MAFARLLQFLSILGVTSIVADNTTDYIHQLEQKISQLESHTLASEQKQAAVLASILSQLQSQQEELQANKDDLQNVTTFSSTSNSSTGCRRVAFEAKTTSENASTLIYFTKMMLNVGGGYYAHRGMFIAPTTGLYQFWFTVFMSDLPFTTLLSKDVRGAVELIAGEDEIGPYYGSYIVNAAEHPGTRRLDDRVVHGLHVVSLTVGQRVYVRLAVTASTVKPGSVFGGMLLG